MFWGWAQTDPAGIHASSAPGLWTWATPARQSNANLDSGRFQEHHVRVLGLGCVLAASLVSTTLISRPTAQTDPAGIHASSAPHEFRHIRMPTRTLSGTPRPCFGAGRKLTLRGFTHPQLQYVDDGPVLYPDALQHEFQHIRMPTRTLSGTPRPCFGAGRKLTLRGFTHPQLQDMDALGCLTPRPGIPQLCSWRLKRHA
ncbi:hypothetical protein D9611_009295 [Ephemerocybe angulata]|uniref:Uncharacterized protein n=1 Tax=Ephemerocybe angulata TaxID=980116 RepID=A0A8H5BGJ9_9AGAR|nr:hypothetical protein D9611_009295 [Tulosesus angulatus]